ncbi:DUF3016 domain-containing protein [Luteimonas wenzhouensis]
MAMRHASRLLLLAITVFAAAAVAAGPRNVTDPDAPRALPDEGPVSVQWTDPAEFADLKYSGNRWRAAQGNWVYELASYLREAAERRLPEGHRLEVTITDLNRAGRYEGWHGVQMQDVRIVRDHYPPSMTLEVRHLDATGQVVDEGTREVRDIGFLTGGNYPARDNLHFEKRMIDRWVRDELGPAPVARR